MRLQEVALRADFSATRKFYHVRRRLRLPLDPADRAHFALADDLLADGELCVGGRVAALKNLLKS